MKKLFFFLFASLLMLASCGTEPYTCTEEGVSSQHDNHYPLTPVQAQVLIENNRLEDYLDGTCRFKYYMYHKYVYGQPRTVELVKQYAQMGKN